MSTRATIQFKDEYDTFYVYRHSDGYPKNILGDITDVLEMTKGRWSGSECGMLVSCFLGMHYKPNERLPSYDLTTAFHGDESYRYYVHWNAEEHKWKVWND